MQVLVMFSPPLAGREAIVGGAKRAGGAAGSSATAVSASPKSGSRNGIARRPAAAAARQRAAREGSSGADSTTRVFEEPMPIADDREMRDGEVECRVEPAWQAWWPGGRSARVTQVQAGKWKLTVRHE
jgi:hypothetical protein